MALRMNGKDVRPRGAKASLLRYHTKNVLEPNFNGNVTKIEIYGRAVGRFVPNRYLAKHVRKTALCVPI